MKWRQTGSNIVSPYHFSIRMTRRSIRRKLTEITWKDTGNPEFLEVGVPPTGHYLNGMPLRLPGTLLSFSFLHVRDWPSKRLVTKML